MSVKMCVEHLAPLVKMQALLNRELPESREKKIKALTH